MKAVAAWIPGWYELDGSLSIGLTDEFVFWRQVPEHLSGPERLVFYNTLGNNSDVVFARGTVLAIHHPEFGDVREIDARGLDYTITLVDGTKVLVNAEENPGELCEQNGESWILSTRVVKDWRFAVSLDLLTEPSTAAE